MTFPWASSCHGYSCLNVTVVSLKLHLYIAVRASGLVIAPLCLTYTHEHISQRSQWSYGLKNGILHS